MHKQVWPPGHCCHCPLPPFSVGPVLPCNTQSWDPCELQGVNRKTPTNDDHRDGLDRTWQALSFVSIMGLGHGKELPSETHKGRSATPTGVHGGLLGEVETSPSQQEEEGRGQGAGAGPGPEAARAALPPPLPSPAFRALAS